MYRRIITALLAVAVAIMATLAANGSAQALPPGLPHSFYGPLPVGLSKLEAQQRGLSHPGATPPGANYFSAADARAHPFPVVLVHGFYENANSAWTGLAPLLRNNHFNVYTLTYGRSATSPDNGGVIDVRASAREVAAYVQQVRRETGAARVDVVGFSEGGPVVQWWINRLGGAAQVHRFVGLSAANAGTPWPVPGLSNFPALAQLVKNSEFYRQLHVGGVTRPEVLYTAIGSRYDEVLPFPSTLLPAAQNVTNVVLQDRHPTDFADHFATPYDPYALAAVVAALDPSVRWSLPAAVVAPYVGGFTPLPGG